ncbi:hypothetical protein O6H91_Y542000 [Diphasiastrum complanatum]|nr:hypothetical protein O6H91_Y542000 [Diphasiastrum complanatum]
MPNFTLISLVVFIIHIYWLGEGSYRASNYVRVGTRQAAIAKDITVPLSPSFKKAFTIWKK